MNAQEMLEKAKKLMEKAKAAEKAEKEKIKATEKAEREKNILLLGQILLRHFQEDFKNCSVEKLKTECRDKLKIEKNGSEKSKIKAEEVEEKIIEHPENITANR